MGKGKDNKKEAKKVGLSQKEKKAKKKAKQDAR